MAAIRTRIPPPVYALATAALMWGADRYLPALAISGRPRILIGWGLIAIGVSLDVGAIGCFVRARTTLDPIHPDRASLLLVSGLYRLSRNPMYLGLLCTLLGWGSLIGSLLSLPLVWLFAFVLVRVQILPEEAALGARFGESYRAYARRVNRWLGWRRAP